MEFPFLSVTSKIRLFVEFAWFFYYCIVDVVPRVDDRHVEHFNETVLLFICIRMANYYFYSRIFSIDLRSGLHGERLNIC